MLEIGPVQTDQKFNGKILNCASSQITSTRTQRRCKVADLIKAELPKLEELALNSCVIGNEGAKHLQKGYWPNFTSIHLRNLFIIIEDNHLSYDGCAVLSRNNWSQL